MHQLSYPVVEQVLEPHPMREKGGKREKGRGKDKELKGEVKEGHRGKCEIMVRILGSNEDKQGMR